jgi:hypothetical protein
VAGYRGDCYESLNFMVGDRKFIALPNKDQLFKAVGKNPHQNGRKVFPMFYIFVRSSLTMKGRGTVMKNGVAVFEDNITQRLDGKMFHYNTEPTRGKTPWSSICQHGIFMSDLAFVRYFFLVIV